MTDYTITPWPDKSFFSGDIPFPEKAAAKPHVIEMSEKDYHRVQAFSSGYLKTLLSGTPHHAVMPKVFSDTTQKNVNIGVAFECLAEHAFNIPLQEAQEELNKNKLHNSMPFQERCVIKPADLNKGEGARARAAEFRKKNAGKTIISNEQLLQATGMIRAALENRGWLRQLRGDWQKCIFWVEEGLPFKAMLDHAWHIENQWTCIDIKTVGQLHHASPDRFQRKAANDGHDLQAVHYIRGMEKVYKRNSVKHWLWLAIEQQYPYASGVYEAGQSFIDTGQAKWEKAVDNIHAFLAATGNKLEGTAIYSEDPHILESPAFNTYQHNFEVIDG